MFSVISCTGPLIGSEHRKHFLRSDKMNVQVISGYHVRLQRKKNKKIIPSMSKATGHTRQVSVLVLNFGS